MHSEILIKNHFSLEIDGQNVYFVSLLPDNFEYLKDAPIKRYKDFPEVYELLFEIQALYERGIIKIDNGKAIISNTDFMDIENEEREKIFFKSPIDFSVEIKDRSLISCDDFHFEYKIRDKEYKNCKIIGCFIIKDNVAELMNKHLYELFHSIDVINNLSNDNQNREAVIWEHIRKMQDISPFTHSVLSGFYRDETIIIPSKMMIDYKEDEKHNIELSFKLNNLDEGEQLSLNQKYETLLDVPSNYSFDMNGKSYRIVLLPEIKDNLTTLKKMPHKIRREKDKAMILKNASSIVPHPEIVSIENFSDRVIDFGLYQNIALGVGETSGIEWKFPIRREIYTISGEKAEIFIDNRDQLSEIEHLLSCAIKEESPSIYYQNENNDIVIPLSVNNMDALKDFCKLNDEDANIDKDDKKKKTKTIILHDDNNKKFPVIVDDILIENLKMQVQTARECKTKLERININDKNIPLTKENIKPLIKIIEIHLIINEDDENVKALNEALMIKFCEDVELPLDMKSHVKLANGKIIPLALKKHQLKGLKWLQNSYRMKDIGRTGVLLADDMGLGKTFQILSFMFWLKKQCPENFDTSYNKPILIVAPVILLENWKQEYHRFFDATLGEPLVLHGETLRKLRTDDGTYNGKEYYQITDESGSPKSYLNTSKILKSNIVITNYDTIVNYEFSLASIDWSCIILDEAQEIKEEQSLKSRILKAFKADFKIACTGTPVENRLTDLWNIFNFLQDNLLGTKKDFSATYSDKSMDDEKYNSLRDKFFYNKPYAYILRRMKNIELKDSLKNKYIKTHDVIMSEYEEDAYASLKNEMIHSKQPIDILLKMNKLSQHPRLINHSNFYDVESLIKDSPKFQKLIEILESIRDRNEKVIIFVLFHEVQKYLKLVLEEKFNIENISIINGSSSSTSLRQREINEFQENPDTFNILILSPLAAGVGLNITGANHVIHYGRWWNPAKENQATDRAYRIGQTKDVYVHYLINKSSKSANPTFDENLHNLITSKLELAENFLKPNNIDISDELKERFKNSI